MIDDVALHFGATHPSNPGFMRISEPSCRGKCRRWVKPVSTLTAASFLSGTSKKDKEEEFSGGLLKQIGKFGFTLS